MEIQASELAEKLLSDSSAAVKFEALMAFLDTDRKIDDEEAKRILGDQARTGAIGLRGGLLGLGSRDPEVERYLERYQEERLRSLKDKELEAAASEDSVLNQAPMFALFERQFGVRGDELRKRVDDQFKAIYTREVATMAERYGSKASDLVERVRSIEEFTRKQLTRKALDIICGHEKADDLGRVRTALKSGFVDYSDADVEYLRKFGGWEDIPLIVEAIERPVAGRNLASLLSVADNSKYRIAARVICDLARDRLAEVLNMKGSPQLFAHLIAAASDKRFRSLDDETILKSLAVDSEQLRKVTALKCIRALPKTRVAKLLASYVSGDQFRYYNAIHWLDFGVSTPRVRAIAAASTVLDREWRH